MEIKAKHGKCETSCHDIYQGLMLCESFGEKSFDTVHTALHCRSLPSAAQLEINSLSVSNGAPLGVQG